MKASASRDPEKLLRLARDGSGTARGELLELYRGYLKLLARMQIGRKLKVKFDASDLVQETFLKAHRAFAQFRGATEAELIQWLRGILATSLADWVTHYRGAQMRNIDREEMLIDELNRSSQALAQSLLKRSSPSAAASRRELAVLVANALDRLPPNYREVVLLRHLEGRSFPEIAEQMGRSVDSVKKLWARALAKLRAQWGSEHDRD